MWILGYSLDKLCPPMCFPWDQNSGNWSLFFKFPHQVGHKSRLSPLSFTLHSSHRAINSINKATSFDRRYWCLQQAFENWFVDIALFVLNLKKSLQVIEFILQDFAIIPGLIANLSETPLHPIVSSDDLACLMKESEVCCASSAASHPVFAVGLARKDRVGSAPLTGPASGFLTRSGKVGRTGGTQSD